MLHMQDSVVHVQRACTWPFSYAGAQWCVHYQAGAFWQKQCELLSSYCRLFLLRTSQLLDGFAWQLLSALLEDRAAWGPRHRIPSLRLLHCGESHCSLSVNLVFSSWLCDSYYYKYCWAELSPNHNKSKNIVLGVSKNLWIMTFTIQSWVYLIQLITPFWKHNWTLKLIIESS